MIVFSFQFSVPSTLTMGHAPLLLNNKIKNLKMNSIQPPKNFPTHSIKFAKMFKNAMKAAIAMTIMLAMTTENAQATVARVQAGTTLNSETRFL